MSGGGTRSGRRTGGGAKAVKMPVKVAAATPAPKPAPAPAPTAKTPSGITYDQFMKMTMQEKEKILEKFSDIFSPLKTPDYLDKSATSKVMYAFGMNGKPEMVSDAEFDKRKGETIYRTVTDANGKMKSADILNQIKTSDYTQLSGSGGSAYGRALYFADTFYGSTAYATNSSAKVMRAKVKPNAKIADDSKLNSLTKKSSFYNKHGYSLYDSYAMTAIVNGYDGWYDSKIGYMMIINRGALVTASTNKIALKRNGKRYSDWDSASKA